MKTIDFNGKKVVLSSIKIEDIDKRDHPDYCNAYIDFAKYDNGEILTGFELDDLQVEYPNLVSELIFENQLWL